MRDPVEVLVQFLHDNEVGPWVTDGIGRTMPSDEWAARFLDDAADELLDEGHADVAAGRRVRALLESKPNQKSFSRTKLREALNDA